VPLNTPQIASALRASIFSGLAELGV
jgi:hypothetical protein